MNMRILLAVGAIHCLVAYDVAQSQVTRTTEVGADGITYEVTRQIVERTVPTTDFQAKQEKVYRPRTVTDYQSYQQTFATPVTEYRWVQKIRGRWNPFSRPYYTQELEPVTRWEYKPATLQIPVTKTDWVEETRTVQVPVTTYRKVKEEYTSRIAVNVPGSSVPASGTGGGGTLAPPQSLSPVVATRPDDRYGSQRLQADPPREPSTLR